MGRIRVLRWGVMALALADAVAGCSTNRNRGRRDASADPLDHNPGTAALALSPKITPKAVAPFEAKRSQVASGFYFRDNVTFTSEIVANIRAIRQRNPKLNDRLFIRIGDSISCGGKDNPFACFARREEARIDLDGRNHLRSTIEYFDAVPLKGGRLESKGQRPEESTSWDRDSWAAWGGVGASWPTRKYSDAPWNDLTPMEKELEQVPGRFALWMLGTNDTCSTPAKYRNGSLYRDYANAMVRTIEFLTSRGIVPIITYIPPVLGCAEVAHWETLDMIAIARALAVAKKIPTIDAFSEIEAIGKSALADGVHLAGSQEGSCVFTKPALKYGVNIRNLRSLEVLDKLRRVVTSDIRNLDSEAPPLFGEGTHESPIDIPDLPFGLASPLNGKETGKFADYSRCGGEAGRNGAEAVYRLNLARPTALRAIAVAGECESETACTEDKEVSVAIFQGQLEMANCITSGSTVTSATIGPGLYYVVMDSMRGRTQPKTGVLAIHECMAGDTRCTKANAP